MFATDTSHFAIGKRIQFTLRIFRSVVFIRRSEVDGLRGLLPNADEVVAFYAGRCSFLGRDVIVVDVSLRHVSAVWTVNAVRDVISALVGAIFAADRVLVFGIIVVCKKLIRNTYPLNDIMEQ